MVLTTYSSGLHGTIRFANFGHTSKFGLCLIVPTRSIPSKCVSPSMVWNCGSSLSPLSGRIPSSHIFSNRREQRQMHHHARKCTRLNLEGGGEVDVALPLLAVGEEEDALRGHGGCDYGYRAPKSRTNVPYVRRSRRGRPLRYSYVSTYYGVRFCRC